MPLVLKTASTQLPVDVSYVKDHSVVDFPEDDTLIESYIYAAVEWVEEYTNRAVLTQTWNLYLDDFSDIIYIPRANLQSVTSILYTDSAGATQTLAASTYVVDTTSQPGRIYEAYEKTWPSIRGINNAINIEFIAGFSDISLVPSKIKHAVAVYVANLYMNRENPEIPAACKALLSSYRVPSNLVTLK